MNSFPYVLAHVFPTPAFSTPAYSTRAVYSCSFHSCIFHSRIFSAPCCFSDINILLSIVATRLRCGEIFYYRFSTNSLLSLLLKEFWDNFRDNFAKFGHLVFEMYARGQRDPQTNRHTDTLITILRLPTGGKVITRSVLRSDSWASCH